MHYLPPIEKIKEKFAFSSGQNGLRASIDYDDLIELIKLYLKAINVDEDWYFKMYPDVKKAVDNGIFKSAAHHFVENGYLEGRLPFLPEFDEEWYLNEYKDVREELKAGKITSALSHYLDHGYAEGRLPSGT